MQDNKQLVLALYDAISQGRLDTIRELVAPSFPGGRDAFEARMAGLRTAFPDIHYVVDDAVVDGDRVAVRWTWTGTHRGPFRAVPASGKVVNNTGMGFFTVQGGAITSGVIETDRLGFLQQLGVVPPDGALFSSTGAKLRDAQD